MDVVQVLCDRCADLTHPRRNCTECEAETRQAALELAGEESA